MNRTCSIFAGVVITTLFVFVVQTRANGSSAEAFEKMKSLAGHWEGSAEGLKPTLDIEVNSDGNSVVEKFELVEAGKPMKMITVYYLDGDTIKLTHYCHAGNQPTMAGTYDSNARTLTFNFLSVTNLKSPNDVHMHHAVFTFIDNDHMKQTWTFQKDQKDAGTEGTTYTRIR